jgi:hypothetical protein
LIASAHGLQHKPAQFQVDEVLMVLLPIGLLEVGFNGGIGKNGLN